MKAILLAALLAGTPTLAAAQQPAAPKANPPAAAEPGKKGGETADKNKKSDDFDMAQMMAMFDKIFPAQPDPAPARLALARTTANGVLPNGTYAAMFEEMMGGLVERVLSMNPADFEPNGAKDKAAAPKTSLREQLAKEDPHF